MSLSALYNDQSSPLFASMEIMSMVNCEMLIVKCLVVDCKLLIIEPPNTVHFVKEYL